jgi:hypothetical protein
LGEVSTCLSSISNALTHFNKVLKTRNYSRKLKRITIRVPQKETFIEWGGRYILEPVLAELWTSLLFICGEMGRVQAIHLVCGLVFISQQVF